MMNVGVGGALVFMPAQCEKVREDPAAEPEAKSVWRVLLYVVPIPALAQIAATSAVILPFFISFLLLLSFVLSLLLLLLFPPSPWFLFLFFFFFFFLLSCCLSYPSAYAARPGLLGHRAVVINCKDGC